MNLATTTSPELVREATPSIPARWVGRVLSGLLVLFLLVDAAGKIFGVSAVLEASAKLGFTPDKVLAIGLILLACTITYVIPRTAVLGAVLLTGYLGGAVCTHVQAFGGAFPIVFAAAFGVLVWVGLGLRDPRVRHLVARREP